MDAEIETKSCMENNDMPWKEYHKTKHRLTSKLLCAASSSFLKTVMSKTMNFGRLIQDGRYGQLMTHIALTVDLSPHRNQ